MTHRPRTTVCSWRECILLGLHWRKPEPQAYFRLARVKDMVREYLVLPAPVANTWPADSEALKVQLNDVELNWRWFTDRSSWCRFPATFSEVPTPLTVSCIFDAVCTVLGDTLQFPPSALAITYVSTFLMRSRPVMTLGQWYGSFPLRDAVVGKPATMRWPSRCYVCNSEITTINSRSISTCRLDHREKKLEIVTLCSVDCWDSLSLGPEPDA
jgi:hypothetical protein